MRIVVIYDISDDLRRRRLARTLERWGLARIQRSAFTGDLHPAMVRDLARLLESMIDGGRDTVHIIPVGRRMWMGKIVLGRQWGEEDVRGATLL